ncbi:MAG: glycosyltransferase family 9 protein [Phycisphaerales bacterium]|nr:MAG: glycosyltransferase family 9 protein [Phycisphaerales bacterium]
MATPALRLLRERLPGAFIGLLLRPGPDRLLRGTDLADEIHVDRAQGVLGPKFVAAKLRPRRYDTALLLTNSFSTALIARIAGVPRRVGYDRDGRGLLLTRKLQPPRDAGGAWALVPAVRYYWDAACAMLQGFDLDAPALPAGTDWLQLPPGVRLELPLTDADREAAAAVLARAGLEPGDPYAILNPGGNNPAKRWPPERFGAVARHLASRPSGPMRCLINGSPAEGEVCRAVLAACPEARAVALPDVGMTMDAIKGLVAGASLMVTNDTGPRHVAAVFGVPLVTLFGPTDHRWTLIPTDAPEAILTADPTLPDAERANDHPERCRVDRITLDRVLESVERVLRGPAPGV